MIGNLAVARQVCLRTFIKNEGAQVLQLGVVGYTEFQLTDDSGTGVTPLNLGARDRAHAIWPEFGVILPAKKINFLARVLPEYSSRSRTRGVTVVFAVGRQDFPDHATR